MVLFHPQSPTSSCSWWSSRPPTHCFCDPGTWLPAQRILCQSSPEPHSGRQCGRVEPAEARLDWGEAEPKLWGSLILGLLETHPQFMATSWGQCEATQLYCVSNSLPPLSTIMVAGLRLEPYVPIDHPICRLFPRSQASQVKLKKVLPESLHDRREHRKSLGNLGSGPSLAATTGSKCVGIWESKWVEHNDFSGPLQFRHTMILMCSWDSAFFWGGAIFMSHPFN